VGARTQYAIAVFRLTAVAVFSLVAMTVSSSAAQLEFENDCDFIVEVPGIFSSSHPYHARKGTVLSESDDHKFCGTLTASTPIGDTQAEECFAVSNGKLISGRFSNKVTSSNCALSDAGRFAALAPTDFALWSGPGPSNLHGQAFLKTVGGDVKTCAGEDVLLLPATPYIDELLAKETAGVTAKPDSRAVSLIRRTICDAQGNFSFSRLPAQRWYVLTKVTWGVPHIDQPGERPGPITSLLLGIPPAPSTDQQGGELFQAVPLEPGDNQVFLTDRDQR